MQIIHLRDFEYWRIFDGLTVEEIIKKEESYEYPPRLQIECKQIGDFKPLYSSFVISKKDKRNEIIEDIAQFSLGMKSIKLPLIMVHSHSASDLLCLLPLIPSQLLPLQDHLLTYIARAAQIHANIYSLNQTHY